MERIARWPELGFQLLHRRSGCGALRLIRTSTQNERSRIGSMAKLPMVQRLAVLAVFQAAVAIAYFSIIESSRAREGSFEKDGYSFWNMYGDPKHKRDQKTNEKTNETS